MTKIVQVTDRERPIMYNNAICHVWWGFSQQQNKYIPTRILRIYGSTPKFLRTLLTSEPHHNTNLHLNSTLRSIYAQVCLYDTKWHSTYAYWILCTPYTVPVLTSFKKFLSDYTGALKQGFSKSLREWKIKRILRFIVQLNL